MEWDGMGQNGMEYEDSPVEPFLPSIHINPSPMGLPPPHGPIYPLAGDSHAPNTGTPTIPSQYPPQYLAIRVNTGQYRAIPTIRQPPNAKKPPKMGAGWWRKLGLVAGMG